MNDDKAARSSNLPAATMAAPQQTYVPSKTLRTDYPVSSIRPPIDLPAQDSMSITKP